MTERLTLIFLQKYNWSIISTNKIIKLSKKKIDQTYPTTLRKKTYWYICKLNCDK